MRTIGWQKVTYDVIKPTMTDRTFIKQDDANELWTSGLRMT